MQFKVVILSMCLVLASAATWRGRNPPKPKEFADKEGCYIKEINDVIPFGATITPIGHCYRIHCSQMMDYASCGAVGTSDDNCYITETDLSKPYPECCPDIKCDEHNQINQID